MTDRLDKGAYLGNPNLKAANVPVEFTEEQIGEYLRCSEDPVYFIKNYVKIVNLNEGLVPFELYEFQERFVKTIHNNRFTISKFPRQSGKSTTVIAYILHTVLFNPNQNVAILANKLATARELLHRLKLAYEHLPRWLQQGVLSWNKGSIELENGSKILASATSSSAVRGNSFNLILLDEFAYVPFNIADEFFSSVYPTISSGKNTKVIIVSTPKGMNMYYKLWTDSVNKRNDYVPVEVFWDEVPGRDEEWKAQTIKNTSEEQFRTEFECDFVGSVHTLISSKKLKTLTFVNPLYKNEEGFKVYEKAKPNHQYILIADTSRGTGNDYHAFTVIDLTEAPYRVVATFRNNLMPPSMYPMAIISAAKQFNSAMVLVELNDIGGQVADIIHEEFEYDGLMSTSVKGRKGQVLDGGFNAQNQQRGVKTTEVVKRVGCTTLKGLIEQEKLVIEDYDLVKELFSFVSKKNSFEAEVGHNDDLVMTLVLFAWLTTQLYFKDVVGGNISFEMYADKMKQLEEDMFFGFVDDGVNDPDGVDRETGDWF
jgi:hypothetical protein